MGERGEEEANSSELPDSDEPDVSEISDSGEECAEVSNRFENPERAWWLGGYSGSDGPVSELRLWAAGGILTLGFVVLAVVLIGNLVSTGRATDSATNMASATGHTVPGGSVHTDDEDGFSIDVPAEWIGEVTGSRGITLSAADLDATIRVRGSDIGLPLCSAPGEHSVSSCAATVHGAYLKEGRVVTAETVTDEWYLICGTDGNRRGFCHANRIGEAAAVSVVADFPDSEAAEVKPIVEELIRTMEPGDLDAAPATRAPGLKGPSALRKLGAASHRGFEPAGVA